MQAVVTSIPSPGRLAIESHASLTRMMPIASILFSARRIKMTSVEASRVAGCLFQKMPPSVAGRTKSHRVCFSNAGFFGLVLGCFCHFEVLVGGCLPPGLGGVVLMSQVS